MGIKRSMPEVELSDAQPASGNPPDALVRFGHLAARALRDGTARLTLTPSPRDSEEKRRDYHRPSDAAKCARQMSYISTGAPKTNPMDLAGGVSTGIGTIMGGVLANAIADSVAELSLLLGSEIVKVEGGDTEFKIGGDGAAEVTFTDHHGKPATLRLSGYVDIIIHLADGRVIVLEVKTVGDFKFKTLTGRGRVRVAEGPSTDYVAQLAEYVTALRQIGLNVVEGVIVVLANNPISRAEIAKQGLNDRDAVAAEWSFTPEELQPIAETEWRRAARVLQLAEADELAPRRIPELPGYEIVQPKTGAARVIRGDGPTETTWRCRYCSWQNRCAEDIVAEQLTPPTAVKASDGAT